jgi:hypothetical protein
MMRILAIVEKRLQQSLPPHIQIVVKAFCSQSLSLQRMQFQSWMPSYQMITPKVMTPTFFVPPLRDAVLANSISEERERVQRRVEGFNWRKSRAWTQLTCLYGPKLNQEELVSIADLVAGRLQIKLDRDARRRKTVIIKWFEENWNLIQPLLSTIVLD